MNTLTKWTAFQDHQQFANGDPWDVALVVSHALQQQPGQNIYIFDDQTGRIVDIDLTISPFALMAQLQTQYAVNETTQPETLRGAGRPVVHQRPYANWWNRPANRIRQLL